MFYLILIGIQYLLKPYIFTKRFVQTQYKAYDNGQYIHPMLFPPGIGYNVNQLITGLARESMNKNKYYGALHLNCPTHKLISTNIAHSAAKEKIT